MREADDEAQENIFFVLSIIIVESKARKMYYYNPIDHVKSAWTGTSSTFGKIAVVLFYFFIWSQVVWGVLLVINPRSGFDCIYDDVSDTVAAYIDAIMIGFNLFSFGYFAFAHYHGIKVWNVLGFFALGLTMMVNNAVMLVKLSANEGDECAEYLYGSIFGQTIVMTVFVVVTVTLTLLDAKMSPVTAPENTPLYS
jgi:hypothetical protein